MKFTSHVHVLKCGILAGVFALYSVSTFSQKQLKKQTMTKPDFTTTILVDQTSQEAFNAIINPQGWWSEEIQGGTAKLNDEFQYQYEDLHRSKMRLIEVIPDKKVVWLVLDNYFKFTKDKTEWTGTKIVFEISEKDDKTQVRFTHMGLVPEYECFEVCTKAWTHYIHDSLGGLITTGKGLPNGKGKPSTEHEKTLTSGN
jgi:hypothetical protein